MIWSFLKRQNEVIGLLEKRLKFCIQTQIHSTGQFFLFSEDKGASKDTEKYMERVKTTQKSRDVENNRRIEELATSLHLLIQKFNPLRGEPMVIFLIFW